MASYNQIIKIKTSFHSEAEDFFAFLQAVGRKYKPPTKIDYKYLGRGRFDITVEGSDSGINALFQELILNKGLYYYVCSIRNHGKKEIINQSVIPIFQGLLQSRFNNPYSHFIRRWLTGKAICEKYVPGELENDFSHKYEVLFRKWDIGSIDDWNFIKDLDSLLTIFMLTQLNHSPGSRSPQFYILVDLVFRKGIGMDPEIKGLFNKIHKLRTDGLHKLNINILKSDISELAFQTYIYFQYFDDFTASQKSKTEKLHGKIYRRIKYGDERWLNEKGEPYKDENGNLLYVADKPCGDCAALKGQYHCYGCDMERCPRCKRQFLSCGCKLQKDYN